MELYGKLKEAKTDRLFNLGKTNGAIVISSYDKNKSEKENLERVYQLKQKIMDKGVAFLPIFCSHSGDENIKLGRTSFFIINKEKCVNTENKYLPRDSFLKWGIELCQEYNKERFGFIDNGEVNTYTKFGENFSTFSSDVMLWEIVHIAVDYKESYEHEIILYVGTFSTLSGKMSHGTAGEIFLLNEELPSCKEIKITEKSKDEKDIEKLVKKLQPVMDYLKDK